MHKYNIKPVDNKRMDCKDIFYGKRIDLQDILRYNCGIKIITFNDDIIIVLLIMVLGILPYSDVTYLSHSSPFSPCPVPLCPCAPCPCAPCPCAPCPVCYDNLSSNLIIYDGS